MPFQVTRYRVLPAGICALALAACVLASRPVLEMGMNDDWSYIWIARGLANTGRVIYNGWAAPMLGWQLYLGALFIKLFGFSFTVVRASMLVLSMGTVMLLHRLFVRLGCNEWNATIATLTVALSPLLLPLSFSFMSDVPGFFSLLLCVYLCVRALQAQSDRAASLWLVLAALTNAVGGTARQISWLGVLVIVPSTIYYMRHRRIWKAALIACVSGVGLIIIAMHWLGMQPYFMSDKIFAFSLRPQKLEQTALELLRGSLALCLLLLPVTLGVAARCRLQSERSKREATYAAVGLGLITLGLAIFAHIRLTRHLSVREITPFFNNIVTARGFVDLPVILGERPEVVPLGFRIALIVITLGALAGCWICFRTGRSNGSRMVQPDPMRRAVLTLLGPYTVVYVGLLISHGQIFDRYLLPLFFVSLVALVRGYQAIVAEHLPFVCIALLVGVAVFSTACLHDLFALDRARLAAANEMLDHGIPKTQFRAGFEYDAWTELELTGYINDERIRIPASAYRASPPSLLPEECQFFFVEHTPDVRARYGLSYGPAVCGPTTLAPINYATWFPPHKREIFIEQLSY